MSERVVFWYGCNVLRHGDIIHSAIALLDAVGIASVPVGGPAFCCGTMLDGDLDGAAGMAARTFKKNFTLVMLDMLTLSRKTGIWPERDVIKYIRSAIAVDGLITRFAPGFSVGRHLEAACARWMTWEARRAALSYDTLVDWATSSGHLASNGAARAATVLRRIADGEMTARIDITTGSDGNDQARRRTLRLAGLVVALMAVIDLSGAPVRPGVNVFTIEATLAGAAALALLWSLRILARTDR